MLIAFWSDIHDLCSVSLKDHFLQEFICMVSDCAFRAVMHEWCQYRASCCWLQLEQVLRRQEVCSMDSLKDGTFEEFMCMVGDFVFCAVMS